MIKLTNGDLNNPTLNKTLMRIANQTGFASPEAAYNFTRLLKQVDVGIKKAREDFSTIAAPFYKKDDEGKLISTPQGPFEFEVMEDKKPEFEAQVKIFFDQPVHLESYPINIEDFGSVDVKPVEFIILEKFMVSDEPSVKKQTGLKLIQEQPPVQ